MFKAFVLLIEKYVAACRNKESILIYFILGSFAVGKYSLKTSCLETFISFVIPPCLYASNSMHSSVIAACLYASNSMHSSVIPACPYASKSMHSFVIPAVRMQVTACKLWDQFSVKLGTVGQS
jgi:hypothetical protein